MTELIIDGVSAVLSKDFSIQVKRENPLFTKNGEYTYDITLPLDNPTNAELYKHLNRLNSTQPVSTDRRADSLGQLGTELVHRSRPVHFNPGDETNHRSDGRIRETELYPEYISRGGLLPGTYRKSNQ